ncbi:translation initiation factor 2 [Sporosarcina sp. FSL W8-0480]|uniref:translation initiation factor 2 n=1 Tax=Sporosarcina sp. FSL W8-0480 TaxID=2954701 RepID=UPI0030DCE1B4
MNNDNNFIDENDNSTDLYVARIAFIGTILSTLGDALQTVSAGVALQQLERSSQQGTQDQATQIETMQKQFDQLTKKIESMEKGNNNQ